MRRCRRALLLSIVALGLASVTRGQDQPKATEPARLMTVWGSPKTQSSQLRSAAFSRDGKRASCAFERECHVWDIERGRPDSAARDGILHPWDAARGDITAIGADLRIYELATAPKVRRALRFYEARWRPWHGKEETTLLRFRD